MKWIQRKYNTWLLDKLVKYSGVWLSPEPGTWGLLKQKEEEDILVQIYENDQIVMLLKKYAEQANKGVLSNLNQVDLGKFLAFNGLLLKCRRAWLNQDKSVKK